MSAIEFFSEQNANKIALIKLAIENLEKAIEKLEWEKQCLLMNILYFPVEKN